MKSPTPPGVPVTMTSPGESGVNVVTYSMIDGISWTRSALSSPTHTVGDPSPPVLGSIPTNRNVITYSPGTRLRVVAQAVPQAGPDVKGASRAGRTTEDCRPGTLGAALPALERWPQPARQRFSGGCQRGLACAVTGRAPTGAWRAPRPPRCGADPRTIVDRARKEHGTAARLRGTAGVHARTMRATGSPRRRAEGALVPGTETGLAADERERALQVASAGVSGPRSPGLSPVTDRCGIACH